jgi:3-oxoacyl-(acyl-carrier-protein) synthase
MTRPRIVVTGMGIVSALGGTLEQTWSALELERSGLGPLTLFSSPRCGHVPVGQVRIDPADGSGLAFGSRSDHLAAFAARRAFADAGLEPGGAGSGPGGSRIEPGGSGIDPDRAGIVLGAITGGMLFGEAYLERLIREGGADPEPMRYYECATSTDQVAGALGLDGFRVTVSTACASGGTAVSTACDALLAGEADLMVAGGVDSLTRLTLNGFSSLLIVAPEGCRPFDAARNGMSLGEGAGMLVLETEAHARARGARIHAVVAGYGSTCDAHHASAPAADGSGMLRAMQRALEAAGLTPADVDYINAHGTGTVDNDLAEGRAITALFGDTVPLVSSTKRFFGHTLAAAGAIEAIVSILALKHQRVPPNIGLNEVDPSVGFMPVMRARDAALEGVMSNSLGFGGNNCSLVFRRWDGSRGAR